MVSKVCRHFIQRLLSKSIHQMPSPPLLPSLQRQQLRALSLNQVPKRPKGLSLVALMWAPSYGVGEAAFKLHGIYPPTNKKISRGNILEISSFNANLVKDLEEHWPNLECYGSPHKYVLFWTYQLLKHGVFSGMGEEEFFKEAMIFMKSLPPTLGLKSQTVSTVDGVLKDLHSALKVMCGLSSSHIRGYICIHDKKVYAMRVLDEVKMATDSSLMLQNMWRPIWCGAKKCDAIFLPRDALDRYKSLVCSAQFVYARGQHDHSRHVYQEFVKKNNRDFIHVENELVPFKILENEQSRKKLVVIVVSAQTFGAEHKQKAIDHVQKAVLAWGIFNLEFIVVVKDMAPINEKWDIIRFTDLESIITKDLFQSLPLPKNVPDFLQNCVTFVPISRDTNIDRKVEVAICHWWKRGCLYNFLDMFELANKDKDHPLRLSILDKCDHYGVRVVVGNVESGTLLPHDMLITPSQTFVKVLQIFEGQDTKPFARVGDLVQVSLSGDDSSIFQGCVLSPFENPVPCVSDFTAILCIEDLANEEKLYKGFQMDLHIHYDIVKCEIVQLIETFDPVTRVSMGKKQPFCMKKGALISAHIKVGGRKVFLEEYGKVSGLGRFVLKIQDRIIASGKVLRRVA